MSAIEDIAAERARQVAAEGWTPEHDDEHDDGQLSRAAACYAMQAATVRYDFETMRQPPRLWPWDSLWWKPKSPRRDLVRAGALIVAEIERLDRLSPPSNNPKGEG